MHMCTCMTYMYVYMAHIYKLRMCNVYEYLYILDILRQWEICLGPTAERGKQKEIRDLSKIEGSLFCWFTTSTFE